MVWRGEFRLEFRDRVVTLGPGEAAVAPRGVEHRTAADHEAEVLIFDTRGPGEHRRRPGGFHSGTAPTGAWRL